MSNKPLRKRESRLTRRRSALPSKPARDESARPVFVNLLAGGGAGAFSRTVTAPLERVKIVLQTQYVSKAIISGGAYKPYAGVLDALIRIPKEQGFFAFWRGNGINVVRIFPNSAIKFSSFEAYKKMFIPLEESEYDSGELFSRKLVCGGLAGATTLLPVYPLDLARTRLTADVTVPARYRGLADLLIKTVQWEGVMGLYKGLGVSLLGIVPYLALSLSLYETLKQKTGSTTAIQNVAVGSVAAILSQSALYPIDTVRRRMQVVGGKGYAKITYSSPLEASTHIFQQHGWRGFYHGLLGNILRAAPQAGIEYASYEFFKEQLF